MYEQVNWDSKIPKKLHAPITTYEFGKPDPLKPTDPTPTRPQIYQTVVSSNWDRLQERETNFIREKVQLYLKLFLFNISIIIFSN